MKLVGIGTFKTEWKYSKSPHKNNGFKRKTQKLKIVN